MAGPWFTVQQAADGWQTLDHIWVADNGTQERVRVDIRLELE